MSGKGAKRRTDKASKRTAPQTDDAPPIKVPNHLKMNTFSKSLEAFKSRDRPDSTEEESPATEQPESSDSGDERPNHQVDRARGNSPGGWFGF